MKLIKSIIYFLIINFSTLSIGSWLMNNGLRTEWYTSLNQAPWTPAGWVFGVANSGVNNTAHKICNASFFAPCG